MARIRRPSRARCRAAASSPLPEIHADRGAHEVFPDAASTARFAVRDGTQGADPPLTGSGAVGSPRAKGRGPPASVTPEQFIRARALDRWAREPASADAAVRGLIEGKLSLDELDLVAQRRLTTLTRRLIRRFTATSGASSGPILGHARLFFGDFTPGAEDPPAATEIEALAPSVQDYLGYVLLDMAVADRDLEDLPLAAAVLVARELGIEERFAGIAAKELKIKKKGFEKVRSGASDIVRRAAEKQ
jgi:hypothetical protein